MGIRADIVKVHSDVFRDRFYAALRSKGFSQEFCVAEYEYLKTAYPPKSVQNPELEADHTHGYFG